MWIVPFGAVPHTECVQGNVDRTKFLSDRSAICMIGRLRCSDCVNVTWSATHQWIYNGNSFGYEIMVNKLMFHPSLAMRCRALLISIMTGI